MAQNSLLHPGDQLQDHYEISDDLQVTEVRLVVCTTLAPGDICLSRPDHCPSGILLLWLLQGRSSKLGTLGPYLVPPALPIGYRQLLFFKVME